MNSNENLTVYAEKIEHADEKRSESVCSKIADRFEDDFLEFDGFPDDYFEFALQLFSNPKFYSKPGVWNFLLVLSAKSQRLQSNHYERLKNVFLQHYLDYMNQDLCLAVCDFIARNYSEDSARNQLNALAKIELQKEDALRGFAIDGMHTVKLEAARAIKS